MRSRTGLTGRRSRLSGNPDYFRRVDESDDRDFYVMPRLVIHVDEHGSAALTEFYGRVLKSGDRVLDLMSAYRSHLPDDAEYARIVGLGMNVTELRENTALRGGVVQDLNRLPALPFADDSFDACLISFSIQYLTQPVRVLADVARVLRRKPEGWRIFHYMEAPPAAMNQMREAMTAKVDPDFRRG